MAEKKTSDEIMMERMAAMQAMRAETAERRKEFAPEEHPAITLYEDAPCYPVNELVELQAIGVKVMECADKEERAKLIAAFAAKRDSIQRKPDAPERIYLWPEGKIPTVTDYTDNSDCRYNHDPDFNPYFYEMLVPEDVTPKGLVVFCAGGDHGTALLHEAYQSCLDFNALGYQAILLANRTNGCPWKPVDAAADASRAIRYARANAARLRIDANNVAFAGFSNGGITGENCIRFFSGEKKMTDYYADYVPDELDAFYGAPDAFLCVYGPRFVGAEFDYTGVVYPPTFYAVGRLDTALDNMNYAYPTLLEQGVPVEIHTFAGVPHGKAGIALFDGEVKYPNFQLWVPLADYFMQDVYHPVKP